MIEALFQSFTLLSPRPPWFFGKHTFSQATLTPPLPSPLPFQRNWLKHCSIVTTTFLGRMKILHQKLCILYKTDCSNCSLPAKDNFLVDQVLILARILSSIGWQSLRLNLPGNRGIPRYLTGSFPSLKFGISRIWFFRCSEVAAQNISLLLGLTAKPEIFSKSRRAFFTNWIEEGSAAVKIRRSSEKLRWVSCNSLQRGWVAGILNSRVKKSSERWGFRLNMEMLF